MRIGEKDWEQLTYLTKARVFCYIMQAMIDHAETGKHIKELMYQLNIPKEFMGMVTQAGGVELNSLMRYNATRHT